MYKRQAVDSTETVSVKAEINDFATAYRIEGSENKDVYKRQVKLCKNRQVGICAIFWVL